MRRLALLGLLLSGCAPEPAPPVPPPAPPPAAPAEAAPEPPAPVLTLAACLRMAEARSETLSSALEQVRLLQAQQREALASALPSLSATASYRRKEGSSDERDLGLSLSQPIFSGFKELRAYRGAGLRVEGAERTREGLLLDIRTAVAEAYGRLLSAERQREAVASSLALALSRLEELRARMRVGLSRRTEVLFAEAQVARNESQSIRLEGARDDARAFLGFLTGRPVEAPLAPFPALEVPSLDVEALTARALGRRQDLMALERQAAAAREAIRVEEAARWPSVDLTGSVYGDRRGPNEAVDWDLALTGSLPLFEGGGISARVAQARSAARQAELALEERRRRAAQAVQEAVSACRASRAALESLERETRAAEENEGLLREEVRQGIAPQIEHLTAQDTLLTARVALAAQRIQDRLSALAVWAALGEFPPLPPEETTR